MNMLSFIIASPWGQERQFHVFLILKLTNHQNMTEQFQRHLMNVSVSLFRIIPYERIFLTWDRYSLIILCMDNFISIKIDLIGLTTWSKIILVSAFGQREEKWQRLFIRDENIRSSVRTSARCWFNSTDISISILTSSNTKRETLWTDEFQMGHFTRQIRSRSTNCRDSIWQRCDFAENDWRIQIEKNNFVWSKTTQSSARS